MPPQSHLTTGSPAAHELAQRLVAREMASGQLPAQTASSPGHVVAVARRLTSTLLNGLARWFGPYGSHALMVRALAAAQASHPVLKDVSLTDARQLTDFADNAARHGEAATLEGVVAIFASLADLIGRLIGEDLAASLLEQSTTTSSQVIRPVSDPMAPDDTSHSVTP